MKYGDKVTITKGLFRGEKAIVIGVTNLNMDHRIIVRREKKNKRIQNIGIYPRNLKLESFKEQQNEPSLINTK